MFVLFGKNFISVLSTDNIFEIVLLDSNNCFDFQYLLAYLNKLIPIINF